MLKLIGKDVKIDETARINVTEKLIIGDRSVIGRGVLIEGRSVRIGKEAWIDESAHIGGGSCFELESDLIVGDFLHMGRYSHINTARKVTLGDEVGIGIGTKVFTHGAYLSYFDGFPVQFQEVVIGDRVWLPNAWVNPGVEIGNDVVVAAMSLVNKCIPSGCLAGGVPVKIIRKNAYPTSLSKNELESMMSLINNVLKKSYSLIDSIIVVKGKDGETMFNLKNKTISGPATNETERLKNQLRRMGIRFRFYNKDGGYVKW
jgi:acetyltransferase-like isoleucine patch superfamily enzyme